MKRRKFTPKFKTIVALSAIKEHESLTELAQKYSVSNFKPPNELQVFPNPINSGAFLSFEGKSFVEYSIASITGQIVQQGKLIGQELNTLQIKNVQTGIYLLLLKTDKQTLIRKIVVK